MPPVQTWPTRSRELFPRAACQPQGGGPSQSIIPTVTVQPLSTLLPTPRSKTLHVFGTLPFSKPPFWKCAADAAHANASTPKHAISRTIDTPLSMQRCQNTLVPCHAHFLYFATGQAR